jgi:predicted aldo/keto reductase-like oxidoreductase
MNLPTRALGNTGVEVTIVGLGGEGILRTFDYEDEADELISAALDLGVTYFESARAYSGSESYYGKFLREHRSRIFLTSKSHARDKKGAISHLETTLRNMRTDHLDLWQVHDMRTREEIEEVFGPGGAIEAFVEAREKGMTRFTGVTGHHDPSILKKCIERFDFDTVLMPVNPAEPHRESFLAEVLPLAVAKNMGIIGMKVYARGLVRRLSHFQSMEPYFRFALSQPVSTVVIGCDNRFQIEENVEFARRFSPMPEDEKAGLIDEVGLHADELMYYKERKVVGEPE